MPIPSIVATFMMAALTITSADVSTGAQAPVGVKGMSRSSSASPAYHRPEGPATTNRQIHVAMQDNTFSPNTFDVRVGDTVTFVLSNFGKAVHDAFIGDKAAQQHHEKEMQETPHGHDHAHEGGVTGPPGKSGTLRYVFDKAGTLEIGCHQPGHYNGGMMAIVNVNRK
jgi:uncharacterized cupredoxin-like copper-binding protein